jgi:hypothetical protein
MDLIVSHKSKYPEMYNFLFSILYTNLKIDIKLAKNKIKHYKNIQNAG